MLPTQHEVPELPHGKIKCFGMFGTKYEIGKAIRPLDNGDWMVSIKLIETGEEVEYRYFHILEDPEAK